LAVAACGVMVGCGGEPATPPSAAPNTAKVERGKLSDSVSQAGILAFRARPDGSPYTVINRAGGTYTRLPAEGEKVGCGGVLYRVDDHPVLLLCGSTPAYRSLSAGDRGRDVAELNANLHLASGSFGAATAAALKRLQARLGAKQTGALSLGQVVFLPTAVRIARVTGRPGGPARPGAPVLSATSTTPEVQMEVDPSQRDALKRGDRARITLPDNTTVTGRLVRFGAVARAPAGQDGNAAALTIPAYVALDHPARAGGLDGAPVQVDITTTGVQDALSVPVTALVGRSGGGFAVEVVGDGGRREVVAVKLGLFDSGGGRVQVEGDLREGDSVVVP
jgi:multidrug efflux pump subunit AcrA (membrane-fusion protein)